MTAHGVESPAQVTSAASKGGQLSALIQHGRRWPSRFHHALSGARMEDARPQLFRQVVPLRHEHTLNPQRAQSWRPGQGGDARPAARGVLGVGREQGGGPRPRHGRRHRRLSARRHLPPVPGVRPGRVRLRVQRLKGGLRHPPGREARPERGDQGQRVHRFRHWQEHLPRLRAGRHAEPAAIRRRSAGPARSEGTGLPSCNASHPVVCRSPDRVGRWVTGMAPVRRPG
jgi:hypothetical protein